MKTGNAKQIAGSISKELVTTWDLFDTLVARFHMDPVHAFAMVDAKFPGHDFIRRRTSAQQSLDAVGAPYVIHDIYRQMVADGLPSSTADQLLVEEIKAEELLLLPIRASIEQVSDADIVVTDMYLSEQQISNIVWKVCGLQTLRPAVRSNWGKASGTIWPQILRHYFIRFHIGDNLRSDIEIPKKYGIETVHFTASQMSKWERKVSDLGHSHLALVLRESRLRGLGRDAGPIHQILTGPYLTLLYAFSVWLYSTHGDGRARFAFLRRDCEDLARVFSSMFPFLEVNQIDLTRTISYVNDPDFNAVIASQIDTNSILVDMLTSGMSAFRFLNQAQVGISRLVTLVYLDSVLPADRKVAHKEQLDALGFDFVATSTELAKHHYPLECLLQTLHPPVTSLGRDPDSGGITRSHGKSDLAGDEAKLIGFKNTLVQEFIDSLQRRGFEPCTAESALVLIRDALAAILDSTFIVHQFPSFLIRERNS